MQLWPPNLTDQSWPAHNDHWVQIYVTDSTHFMLDLCFCSWVITNLCHQQSVKCRWLAIWATGPDSYLVSRHRFLHDWLLPCHARSLLVLLSLQIIVAIISQEAGEIKVQWSDYVLNFSSGHCVFRHPIIVIISQLNVGSWLAKWHDQIPNLTVWV